MNTRPRRLALLGLALGVLLALVIAPQTRWLVRLQALTSLNLYHPLPLPQMEMPPDVGNSYSTSEASDSRLMRRVAERHPNDYATQYAYAVGKPGAPETLAALRALALRFPEEPSLCANLLRHETGGDVKLGRAEDFMGAPVPADYKPASPPPAALATFDREAAAGERLDPDNAYFPLMRAVGLFAAHRDAEGLAAVHRASLKRSWREYLTDDVHHQWRLHEEAFGDPGGLGRIALFSQTLLPQYANLRAVARVTAYKAIQAEQEGHAEQGLAVRRDLIRCGDLMRDQSTTYIGSLVAVAITYIARGQPGGFVKPSLRNAPGLTPEQNSRRRLDLYCTYVRHVGHPEDAEAARADFAASEKVRTLGPDSAFEPMVRHDTHLVFWWLTGLATLANLFWLLILGGLASALARTRRVREPAPWNGKEALGRTVVALGLCFVASLLALLVWNVGVLSQRASDRLAYVSGMLLLATLVSGLRWVHLRYRRRVEFAWRAVGGSLLAVLLVAACLFSFYALARWQAGGMQGLISAQRQLVSASGGSDTSAEAEGGGLTADEQAMLASVAASLALPLLLALVLAIAAPVRHVPALVGLVRGFQSAAVPLACGLLLVYGGLTLATVRQDGVVREETERMVTGEGRYLAEQAGQPWPMTGR